MGEQGAALQKYNQELVKCIEHMKIKREELSLEIEKNELIKSDLEGELGILQEKLDMCNTNLKRKRDLLCVCEKSIRESEAAFMKILESSQVLLSKVLKESEDLNIKDVGDDD